MSSQGPNDSVSNASNKVHLHPVDGSRWAGVVQLRIQRANRDTDHLLHMDVDECCLQVSKRFKSPPIAHDLKLAVDIGTPTNVVSGHGHIR